jgi:RNA polymerase sigma-70 factor, ECF subfamily
VATPAESDQTLGVLALGGDAVALAVLLERCRPSLYASAMASLNNRAEALDAVQDTFVTALLRIGDVRDPAAVRGWLHAVLRNVCRMRLRRRREVLVATAIEAPGCIPGPEEALETHVLRDWVWDALEDLSVEERMSMMLRHFSRCTSYEAIAAVTGVPVGTVRSRLSRARSRLAEALMSTVASTPFSHDALESEQRQRWAGFYHAIHEAPVPRTYRDLFSPDVLVTDVTGGWHGIEAWSEVEREAISLGVRARIVGLLAGRDITVLEIDFDNPPAWPDHCPPRATFVHCHDGTRSRRLLIHYPGG